MMDFDLLFPNRESQAKAAAVLESLPKLDWEIFFENKKQDVTGTIHPSCVVAEDVGVGEGSEVGPFCVIEKNVSIGKNCVIRSHVLLREGTVIGDDVVIGHGTEVKHSFVFDRAKIGSHAFVGDSIVGYGARIGTGVVTGNRRFDQQPVHWHLEIGNAPALRDKVGCLIGDFVRLGANVTTNPGTIIGAYTWISGGQGVNGFIPPKMFLKPDGALVANEQAGDLDSVDRQGAL